MKLRCTLLFLILFPLGLSAQPGDMDAALDRYEAITAECIRVKQSVASGEEVPRAELTGLAAQLNELKARLQGASGLLTAAQRRRVAEIRKMYSDGVVRSTAPVFIPVVSPVPTTVLSCPLLPDGLAGECSSYSGTDVRKPPLPVDYLLFAEAGLVPDLSAGIRVGALFGNWGVYMAGRGNFVSPRHSYECLSDGRVSDGSIIWTSGASKVSRLNLTAGALWHPLAWGTLYGGCGYGRRLLLWQDSIGEWAAVSDRSASGPAVEAGIILHYDRLAFSSGVSVIPPSGGKIIYADMTAGIGWQF
jgi:hypothetical protein